MCCEKVLCFVETVCVCGASLCVVGKVCMLCGMVVCEIYCVLWGKFVGCGEIFCVMGLVCFVR